MFSVKKAMCNCGRRVGEAAVPCGEMVARLTRYKLLPTPSARDDDAREGKRVSLNDTATSFARQSVGNLGEWRHAKP